MTSTLSALHRAVIASPTDRTVRLVYADALEESGEPAHLARAEFIRAQIELDTAPDDKERVEALNDRSAQLFAANWLAWWTPVAKSAGLPPPHRPGKRIRDRIARVGRTVRGRRKPANWPYSISAEDTTVHLVEFGLSFVFRAGFPEEVQFHGFETPESEAGLHHQWGDHIPLTRLVVESTLDEAEWRRIDGAHLARLGELVIGGLLPETAPLVAASPHLASVSRLAVNPVRSDPETIRPLISRPAWNTLRSLHFTGRLSPEGVEEVASGCTLEQVEELEVGIGNPSFLGNPVFEAAGAIVRAIARAVAHPVEAAPRWAPFGPALETLAAAEWIRRLRILRVTTGRGSGLLAMISDRLHGQSMDVIPDAAVLALAEGVRSDKLERLVLPAAILSPTVREELTTRMGPTVVFE
jgi:uncharacterized protein (TIGR02996 family)